MNLQAVSVVFVVVVGIVVWVVWTANVAVALVRRRRLPTLIRRVGNIRIQGSKAPIHPWQAWLQLAFALVCPLALIVGLRDSGWSAEQHLLMAFGLISMVAWTIALIVAVLRAPTATDIPKADRERDPKY